MLNGEDEPSVPASKPEQEGVSTSPNSVQAQQEQKEEEEEVGQELIVEGSTTDGGGSIGTDASTTTDVGGGIETEADGISTADGGGDTGTEADGISTADGGGDTGTEADGVEGNKDQDWITSEIEHQEEKLVENLEKDDNLEQPLQNIACEENSISAVDHEIPPVEAQETLEETKNLVNKEASEAQETLEETKSLVDQEAPEAQETLEETKNLVDQEAPEAQETLEETKNLVDYEAPEAQETLEETKNLVDQEAPEAQESLEETKNLVDQETLEETKNLVDQETPEAQQTLEETKNLVDHEGSGAQEISANVEHQTQEEGEQIAAAKQGPADITDAPESLELQPRVVLEKLHEFHINAACESKEKDLTDPDDNGAAAEELQQENTEQAVGEESEEVAGLRQDKEGEETVTRICQGENLTETKETDEEMEVLVETVAAGDKEQRPVSDQHEESGVPSVPGIEEGQVEELDSDGRSVVHPKELTKEDESQKAVENGTVENLEELVDEETGIANNEGEEINEDTIEAMDIDGCVNEELVNQESNGMANPEADAEVDGEGNEEDELISEDTVNGTLSEGPALPQCRLKRNYSCVHCGINTQNPREYLYHLRDTHGERMKVFECPRCIYASKNHQKLIRHARMVHKLKINKQPESTSPYKSPVSPLSNVSPVKSTRASVSPSKSARNSPVKSPRSYDSTSEQIDEDHITKNLEEISVKTEDKKIYRCEHCDYVCKSRKLLNRHETSYHLKRRFFRCVKCNYVTHLKGRYTKHMKYHALPILKCDFCDFRTPYRWNLDRHVRNHTEDCGDFKCHLCNFTAQNKQSLTVHISNHHLTAEQIRQREAKRTIGIIDPSDCTQDEQEMEMMRLERDEHPDALMLPGYSAPSSPSATDSNQGQQNGNSFRVSNIDMGNQEDSQAAADDNEDDDGEPRKKKPKIKITLKKMKVSKPPKDTFFQELNERHNFEEDFIHPDDVVHRHGNVYIKTFKCRYCPFKAAFKNEVLRHEKKLHCVSSPRHVSQSRKARRSSKSYSVDDTPAIQFPTKSSPEGEAVDQGEKGGKNDTETVEEKMRDPETDENSKGSNSMNDDEDTDKDHGKHSKESTPVKDSSNKKKNPSFFDKLQEKMPTSNVQNLVCQFCGHESKCLSESVRHQKLHLSAKNIYASASLSTRCQFCRHRCKTTDDLMNHLKHCSEARKNQITDSGRRPSGSRAEGNEDSPYASERGDEDEENDDACEKNSVTEEDEQTKQPDPISDDEKHPMENRVFVWNTIKGIEEEQKAQINKGKQATDVKAKQEKVDRRSSTESIAKETDCVTPKAQSPIQFESYYVESPTPQGHHHYTKRVYRCPQCSFWATTASRFHVHIVGHFNRKPYNCSECGYKSNWRWDITKHIKLKMSRDSSHRNADVIITDETGEKNYEKYDCYLTVIQLDETNAHRTEGGIPTRKGRPKRTPEKEEPEPEPEATPQPATPIRKPPMVTIPVMPRLQNMPRLTRAPGRSSSSSSRPGPMPFGPILPGPQMMVQLAGSGAAGGSGSRPPPPLTLRGTPKASAGSGKTSSGETNLTPGSQYQIITPQMRLLAWLNLLMGETEEEVTVSSTNEDGREVAKMVLDHEGNPEWKCNTCDFRDSERDTIIQHVRLAHTRNGPVSLLHAVHRCDLCGYAAGTKRAVQLHIDSSHGGQGGITSRCEGQNPDAKDTSGESEHVEFNDNTRTYQCRMCPFTCKKRSEMRPHLIYHTPRTDCIFKCMFCPYYVPTKGELFEHLSIHGMEIPGINLDSSHKSGGSNLQGSSGSQEESGIKQFPCGACPFETRSRSKLMHHRQFHKPKGLPFRCPHCSYNVTRRHLLAQHIRVHGVEEMEGGGPGEPAQVEERSNSPSPSLTITPVTNATSSTSQDDPSFPDPSQLPRLSDEATMLLEDIPLVWVSRDRRFFKMFKCRHCPHVNLRKTNIQEHEKMHRTDPNKESGLHCPYCSYVSVNAGVMSAHLKVHGGSMGQCHAVVNPNLTEEDQLKMITTRVPTPDTAQTSPASDSDAATRRADEKLIYYCQSCPARFFFEKEIQIHSRFHSVSLPHTCEHCNYGARHPAHLLTHRKVHTTEYQQRTLTMMGQHRTALAYPPKPGLTIPLDAVPDTSAKDKVVKESGGTNDRPIASPTPQGTCMPPQPPPTSKYMCDQCPASFSKLLTLQYHQSLHGTQNPHPCSQCSYAGKTLESLQQHLQLHTKQDQAKETSHSQSPSDQEKGHDTNTKSKEKSKGAEKDGKISYCPPIKLKLIGLKPGSSESADGSRPLFKYYVEEQVPLSGIELLKRKMEKMEKEGQEKGDVSPTKSLSKSKISKDGKEDVEENNSKRIGDPSLHYPLHIDKVTGKSREKRYKCSKCPSAFEKVEQYNVHWNLHDSNHKYRCRICDYSVKFYANFMMHINRHKYHERMVYQTDGSPLPPDSDPKYEPIINRDTSSQSSNSSNSSSKEAKIRTEDVANKENVDDADLTTSERQHLLLQNKKGVSDASKKDEEKERRVYYCQYCPYANIRRDAVDSHSLRHRANGGFGSNKCVFCDYTASQPNFIREHTKVHFRPFKYVHPEGYMRHDKEEIMSTAITRGRTNSGAKKSDGETQKKHLVFSHDPSTASACESDGEGEETPEAHMVRGITVSFKTGDVVSAPNDFVISLRPTKSKLSHCQNDVNDTTAAESTEVEKMEEDIPCEVLPQTSENAVTAAVERPGDEDVSMKSVDTDTGKMEKPKKDDHTESPPEPSSPEQNQMELENATVKDAPVVMSNGHDQVETASEDTEKMDVDEKDDVCADESVESKSVTKVWSEGESGPAVDTL